MVWETFYQQPLTLWTDGHWMFLMKDYTVLEEKTNAQLKTQTAKQVMSTLPQVQGPRSTSQAQPPPGGTSEGLRDKMLNTANNFIKKI